MFKKKCSTQINFLPDGNQILICSFGFSFTFLNSVAPLLDCFFLLADICVVNYKDNRWKSSLRKEKFVRYEMD